MPLGCSYFSWWEFLPSTDLLVAGSDNNSNGLKGNHAFRLNALGPHTLMRTILIKSGARVFIDGSGHTLQISPSNQIQVEAGASLCLCNITMKGGTVYLVIDACDAACACVCNDDEGELATRMLLEQQCACSRSVPSTCTVLEALPQELPSPG